jgi:uncharacterized protein YbjT (DUF2867 family)
VLGVLGCLAALHYNGLGRYEEAFAAARAACESEDCGFYAWCPSELVEAAARTGEQQAGAEAVQRLEERTATSGTDWGLRTVARAQVLLADDEHADHLFNEAIELLSRTRLVVHAARNHLVYGEWLRRVRRCGDARRHLTEAHRMFTRMGAQSFAERARRELVETGQKVSTQAVSCTPSPGPADHVACHGPRTADYGFPRVRYGPAPASLNSSPPPIQTSCGRFTMKVVVIGGTGLIGSKVVAKLNGHGHDATAASPDTGVNTVTGAGLAEALAGASVVVDVSNSPSFEDGPAWDFFTTATGNILTAAEQAGVGHYVALSIVGTERLLASGYFRAKHAQETLIVGGAVPFSIVRATQFFEFIGAIADSATDGDTVRISAALSQPMSADEVATAVATTAIGEPLNATREVTGPDHIPLDELVRIRLRAINDNRRVLADPQARYFGVPLDDHTLVAGSGATVFPTHFTDWLSVHALSPSH